MLREILLKNDICNKCPYRNECSRLVKLVNNYDDFFIELIDEREFSRFIKLSITTSNNISKFEYNHSMFISLIENANFDFDYICHYILDVKFRVWRESIQTISDLMKYMFIIRKRNNECAQFKRIVELILDYYKDKYTTILQKICQQLDNDFQKKIIKYFIQAHEKLYYKFKDIVLTKIKYPKDNGDFNSYIEEYSRILTQAMELTVIEVISINRLLVDNKVYVTSEVINWINEYNFNVIKNIKDVVKESEIKDIIFAESGIERYRFLFSELIA